MIEESVSDSKPTFRDLTIDALGNLSKTFLWTSWMLFVYIGLPVAAWKYFEMGQAIPKSTPGIHQTIHRRNNTYRLCQSFRSYD
jgi:hypothetical protein